MSIKQTLALLVMAAFASTVFAHKASDSFLYVDMNASQVRIDVALRDLALLVPLDTNGDLKVTVQELRAQRSLATQAIENALTLTSGQTACELRGLTWGLSAHSDGPYLATEYRVDCPNGEPPEQVEYTLLFDTDSLHRGLIQITSGETRSLTVASPDKPVVDLTESAVGAWSTFGTFLYEGIVHLLIGLDHMLFLLVLVLPATLINRRENSQGTARSFKSRLLQLAGIVTAFTLAHSITLALSALDVIQLPIAWVETVIALSIAAAALNVVWPFLGRKTWKLAFAFGLIHGFGFASVLGDLTGGVSNLALALAGFNLGVEFGQLGLLLIGFPLLYALAHIKAYQRFIVPLILLGVGSISLMWVAERAGSI
ncbi:HupE/UreJ family protein [Marinobacter sp. 1-4A]|uniref:HupE/UreJ family protein n=1 Tax=Marinobacter sp. 1-4A TaxID=2582919 RepID=UPI001905DDA0|nr:HupE/UreJ family protein [Marinobacter sp. 1-4A]MBK1851374.1 HupE/UreJ family protein [Marinobacter sp. 1-4A]